MTPETERPGVSRAEAERLAIAVGDAFRRSALRWARRDPPAFAAWATTMLNQLEEPR